MRENRISALALTAIIALAVYVRLAHLDLAEFKRDEAAVALLAADLAAGRTLPLTGIGTSIPGLENGPMMVYLLALPLLLARDAALASGFIALLNVAAIIATARVTERIFGRLAGLFAAAAYAFASWAIVFSRKLWANEAMPLFSALLALGLYDAAIGGRPRGLILAGAALGILLNLHPSAAMFLPFVALAFLLRPRLVQTKSALAGAGLVAACSLPFLIHEIRTGFPILRVARGLAGTRTVVDATALDLSLILVGPGAFRVLAGEAVDLYDRLAWPADGLGEAMVLALLAGIIAALIQFLRSLPRGSGWRQPVFGLIWLVAPLAVASRQTVPLQIHYLIPLLPALFAFVGAGLALPVRVARAAPRPIPVLMLAVPVFLLAWSAAIQIQHFSAFVEVLRQAAGRTLYGMPLLNQRTAVERAVTYAMGRPIALITQRGAADADDLPPIWRFLVPPPVDFRVEDGGGALRLLRGTSLYVVAPSADPTVTELLRRTGGVSAGLGVALPGRARGYEYWRAMARPAAPGRAPIGRLANGLRLDDATYPARIDAVDTIAVTAQWRIEQAPPADELAVFVHLLDDRGEKVAGADRSELRPGILAPGDELLTWTTFPRPPALAPGRYWLSIGVYRAQDVRRIAAIDEAGAPIGDAIRVGPLKVAVPLVPSPGPALAELARFAGEATLLRGSVPSTARAGQPFEVDLLWQAASRIDRDLTVFIHLVDRTGKVVAQDDREPADRTYPTSIWDIGERVPDRHTLSAPAGQYRVLVGVYDSRTHARLARTDAPGDSVEIGTIVLEP